MATTKTNWHELSVDDLKAKLEELTKERFNLRFRSHLLSSRFDGLCDHCWT